MENINGKGYYNKYLFELTVGMYFGSFLVLFILELFNNFFYLGF